MKKLVLILDLAMNHRGFVLLISLSSLLMVLIIIKTLLLVVPTMLSESKLQEQKYQKVTAERSEQIRLYNN